MLLQNYLIENPGMLERSAMNYNLALQNQISIFGDPVASALEGSTAIIKGSDPLSYALQEAGRGSATLFDADKYRRIVEWLRIFGAGTPQGVIIGAAAQAGEEAGRQAAGQIDGSWDALLKFVGEHFLLVVIGLILFGAGLLLIVFDQKETIIKAAGTVAGAAL